MGIDIQQDDLSSEDVQSLIAEHLSGMHTNSPPGHVHALAIESLSRLLKYTYKTQPFHPRFIRTWGADESSFNHMSIGGLYCLISAHSARKTPLSCHCAGLRTQLPQGSHPYQVVGGHVQHKNLIHFLQSPHHHLPDTADKFGPAKTLFDQFSFVL